MPVCSYLGCTTRTRTAANPQTQGAIKNALILKKCARQGSNPLDHMTNGSAGLHTQDCSTHGPHMGQDAPRDILVTFVIGADDKQCHKTPNVMIIVGNKRSRKVVHCSQTGGLGDWGENFGLLQPVSNHPRKDNLTVSIVGSH